MNITLTWTFCPHIVLVLCMIYRDQSLMERISKKDRGVLNRSHIGNQHQCSFSFINSVSVVSLPSDFFCSPFPNFQSVVAALGFTPEVPELDTRAQSTEFIRPSHCNQCSRDNSENLNQILCDFSCLTAQLLTPSATTVGAHEWETNDKKAYCIFQGFFFLSLFLSLTVEICPLLSPHLHAKYPASSCFRETFGTILSHLLTLN